MPLIHQFAHLLGRVFMNWYTFLGTSPGGIVAQIATLFVAQIRRGWWSVQFWKTQWKSGLKRAVYGLGAVWVIVFMGCTVATVYNDHQALVNANRKLQDALRESEKGKNTKVALYGFAMDNEYASISNVLGALSFLAHTQPPKQPLGKNPCVLKITAPKENLEIARIMATLAGQFGCVVSGPDNPNFDPEIDRQTIEGMVPDTLLVRAPKNNEQASGVITDLANVFTVKRKYEMPEGSPPNMIWFQFGSGSVWRKPLRMRSRRVRT